jgi:DNA-binding transcriptional MerR regulator
VSAGARRRHLSIGEVLGLLQGEFPDVTISKIRFLESQGLIDPERTPSGYRKFYEGDIDRLRWILLQQRDHFLPLKVIKDRLDEADALGLALPESAGPESSGPESAGPESPAAGDEPADAPAVPVADPVTEDARAVTPSTDDPPSVPPASDPAADAAPDGDAVTGAAAGGRGAAINVFTATPHARPRPEPARPVVTVGDERHAGAAGPVAASGPGRDRPVGRRVRSVDLSSVSFTVDELAAAVGSDVATIEELERFGLVTARTVSTGRRYGEDAVVVARLAARFAAHGIEARHLRMFKVAVDRELALYEQVITPLRRDRTGGGEHRVAELWAEFDQLGAELRDALFRRDLT